MTIAAGKGAKLDFKSPEALAHCLTYASRHALCKIPLCLSADILPGPGGGPPRFKAAEFLRMCREYSAAGDPFAGLDGRRNGNRLHERDDRHYA